MQLHAKRAEPCFRELLFEACRPEFRLPVSREPVNCPARADDGEVREDHERHRTQVPRERECGICRPRRLNGHEHQVSRRRNRGVRDARDERECDVCDQLRQARRSVQRQPHRCMQDERRQRAVCQPPGRLRGDCTPEREFTAAELRHRVRLERSQRAGYEPDAEQQRGRGNGPEPRLAQRVLVFLRKQPHGKKLAEIAADGVTRRDRPLHRTSRSLHPHGQLPAKSMISPGRWAISPGAATGFERGRE